MRKIVGVMTLDESMKSLTAQEKFSLCHALSAIPKIDDFLGIDFEVKRIVEIHTEPEMQDKEPYDSMVIYGLCEGREEAMRTNSAPFINSIINLYDQWVDCQTEEEPFPLVIQAVQKESQNGRQYFSAIAV